MSLKRKVLLTLGWIAAGIFPLVASAESLSGVWSGIVSQANPKESYPMTMKLEGPTGTTEYPTLGCGGKVSLLKDDGPATVYLEHLRYGQGKCIDGGVIAVVPHEDTLIWEWRGGGVSASAVLKGALLGGK